MKRTRNQAGDRRRRKMFTVLWTTVLAIATIVMIYREMTALLYILATIGVTALLVVVAQSDLAQAEKVSAESPPMDDSAAIGSGIKSTFGNNKS
jgi:Flp pilus assembly protein TadB